MLEFRYNPLDNNQEFFIICWICLLDVWTIFVDKLMAVFLSVSVFKKTIILNLVLSEFLYDILHIDVRYLHVTISKWPVLKWHKATFLRVFFILSKEDNFYITILSLATRVIKKLIPHSMRLKSKQLRFYS